MRIGAILTIVIGAMPENTVSRGHRGIDGGLLSSFVCGVVKKLILIYEIRCDDIYLCAFCAQF